MKVKKKGYGFLLGLTILLTVSAALTLIPHSGATKDCLLGYQAVCSFTPVSTLILLAGTALICVVRKRKFTEETESGASA